MTTLKQRVLRFITAIRHVSFMDLLHHFGDEAWGNEALSLTPMNLRLWDGISLQLSTALLQLIQEDRIKADIVGAELYTIDGGGLNLPVANAMRLYHTLHWLPVVFNPM
jgi:hypothetical protein